jgi:hypothetical protein
MRRSIELSLLITAGFLLSGGPALADRVTATVVLDSPPGGYYQLLGQSANFSTRTNSGTSGGLLDGVTSPGQVFAFTEFFPADGVADYQTFGYYGRVIAADPNDPNVPVDPNAPVDPNCPADPNNAVDPRISFVMAFQPGEGVGLRIGDYFAGRKEHCLVQALSTFDSPEFLSILETIGQVPACNGLIELPNLPRAGETLDLVAFIGGPDGDLGVKIGEFSYSIVRAPGDVDGDNDIDLDDLLVVLGAFGLCQGDPGYSAGGDLSFNGCIDLDDLLLVLGNL